MSKPYFTKQIEEKLVLCSRDIQVGDEVTFKYDSRLFIANQEHVDYNLKGMKEWAAEGSNPIGKPIGEVSPEATWVKPDIEFGEDEVRLLILTYGVSYVDKAFQSPPPSKNYGDTYNIIEFKCPHCGKFS